MADLKKKLEKIKKELVEKEVIGKTKIRLNLTDEDKELIQRFVDEGNNIATLFSEAIYYVDVKSYVDLELIGGSVDELEFEVNIDSDGLSEAITNAVRRVLREYVR